MTRDAMWQRLSGATAEVMINAPRDGDLRARYVDNSFLPSCTLEDIGPFLE